MAKKYYSVIIEVRTPELKFVPWGIHFGGTFSSSEKAIDCIHNEWYQLYSKGSKEFKPIPYTKGFEYCWVDHGTINGDITYSAHIIEHKLNNPLKILAFC